MATQKWKRKKYQEPAGAHGEEEEFSPLGLSLLEQFASGMNKKCPLAASNLCRMLAGHSCLDHMVKLRGHLSKLLHWQQPRVVPTLLICSNWLHWGTMGGLLNT